MIFLLLFHFVFNYFLTERLDSTISNPKNYVVYVFLSEECPISQYYTLELNEIYTKYHSDSVVFKGVFSIKTSTPATIKKFVATYQIPFITQHDARQRLAKKLGATIVPQIFVLQGRRVLYSGKIDNNYERVGKRRTIVTQHPLRNVLDDIVANKKIVPSKTEAIGCIFR